MGVAMKGYGLLTQTRAGRVAFRRLRGAGRLAGGPADELAAIQEYLEAHAFLPDDTTLAPGELPALCGLLDGGRGSREEVVRALVILAHVGREPALGTLRRYVERAPPGLEALAALALDECEVWAGERRPPYAAAVASQAPGTR